MLKKPFRHIPPTSNLMYMITYHLHKSNNKRKAKCFLKIGKGRLAYTLLITICKYYFLSWTSLGLLYIDMIKCIDNEQSKIHGFLS